eukprot:839321-Rhodomonas_salina.1
MFTLHGSWTSALFAAIQQSGCTQASTAQPAADKVALAAAAALAAVKDKAQKRVQCEARKLELNTPEKCAAAKQEERDELDYDSD